MINIRKRNNLYEYRFEVGKVNGKSIFANVSFLTNF